VIVTVAEELGLVIGRKRAEESLMREKSFSDATIDSLPGVFYHYDHNGRFLRWNKNFERVTGYSQEEIAGMHPLDFFSGDDKHLIAERIGEVFNTSESAAEAGFVCKDGSVIPYYFTGRRVFIDGNPYLIGVGVDITERVRADEDLRRAQAELAHVARVTTMGELAASIAHEVNQPLGAIVGNAEICLQKLNDGQLDLELVREALADIVNDGLRASEVIAGIRALVRKSTTQKKKLELNLVIREVFLFVGQEARRKGIVLRADLDVVLPFVLGDRVQLQQVLLNLVINGIEAMDGVEGRTRELSVRTERGKENVVVVGVRDCGAGIAPQDTEQIFKPFHTTKTGGMGMGLPISRSIIEAHGGRLWAEANDGPGTTFTFTLPIG
jgi:PAS domain S-box-containing protein